MNSTTIKIGMVTAMIAIAQSVRIDFNAIANAADKAEKDKKLNDLLNVGG